MYILSLVRLEISICPFRFQSHDHTRLSIISILLIVGIPVGEIILRLLVQGHACECDTFVMVRGLYEGQEMFSSGGQACSQVNLL